MADAAGGERGSITLWLLGLTVVILFVAGLSVDLWRAVAERRALAGVADAAARAGVAMIDEDAFRDHGHVRLDPPAAHQAAQDRLARALAGGDTGLRHGRVEVADGQVVVVADGHVELTLLKLLRPTRPGWTVRVHAVAEPAADP